MVRMEDIGNEAETIMIVVVVIIAVMVVPVMKDPEDIVAVETTMITIVAVEKDTEKRIKNN